MRRTSTFAAVALLGLSAATVEAANHVLDVSRAPGVTTLTVPAGQLLGVTIVNLAPAAEYDVSVLTEIIEVPPLDPAGLTMPTLAAECAALSVAKTLTTEGDEARVSRKIGEIEDARTECSATEQRQIDLLLGSTRRSIAGGVPRPGEQVRVVVKRNTEPSKTWVLLLTTGARGNWRTLYGLALGPGDEDRFFSSPGDEAGQFVVTRERDGANEQRDLAAIPAAFFQWMPLSGQLKDWAVGPTLGLGVKSDRPAFFIGGIVTYNQNLGLVVGVPVYQEWKLRGNFQEGQTIAENLNEEQLHKRSFRFQRLFVAGVYRFGSNPFGAGDDVKKEPDPEPKK